MSIIQTATTQRRSSKRSRAESDDYANILANHNKKIRVETPQKADSSHLASPPPTPLKSDSSADNKENYVEPAFSDREIQLIKEAEAYDRKHGVELPVFEIAKETIYTRAKRLFAKSVREDIGFLVGRESEGAQIEEFLFDRLQDNINGFLYVAGPPGSGKTQQLKTVLSSLSRDKVGHNKYRLTYDEDSTDDVNIVQVNCMRLSNVNELFVELLTAFGVDYRAKKSYAKYTTEQKTPKDLLFALLGSRDFSDHNIIVLDELDALLSLRCNQALFDFFLLTKESSLQTKLILVGIANALNLVDRISPRLKLNGLEPKVISFLPYTTDQIVAIVLEKLKTLHDSEALKTSDELPVISRNALSLCARKTAANTGDLRKVFDVLYAAIELVEKNTRKQFSAVPGKSLKEYNALTAETAPKVSISHVARICATALNGTSSLARLKLLNLHQCLVLICLARLEQTRSEQSMARGLLLDRRLKPKAIGVSDLFTFYRKLTQGSSGVPALSKPEFSGILSTLQTLGVVNVVNRGQGLNITSQSVLSCCGVGLGDLSKVVEEKYEILRGFLRG